MTHHILMIDVQANHQRVMRHFIERVHPDIQLSGYDPQDLGMPGPDFKWSDYDLLIIDNELGETDGVEWLKTATDLNDFPPFIILSSTKETDTPAAMESVIRSIRMGAVNYLFKKKMQINQLNENIVKVLENVPHRKDSGTVMNTAELAERRAAESVEDTKHEINLAMAMLNGHTEWPFTMGEILAGKATIGEYKVISYLGNQTGGAAFKVKHDSQKDPLVMYFISHARGKNSAIPDKLIGELEIMKAIEQPNLWPIYDYQLLDDAVIVIRQYIEGETLEQRLKVKGVHAEQAVSLFKQILLALAALHQHQIYVKQFSPKCLRFNECGCLILPETGLIQRLHAINEVTGSMRMTDTPIYTTPEFVQGRSQDHRSDIYLAGLIGYELIAGKPVFSKGSAKDIMYSHVIEAPPDLPEKNHPLNFMLKEMLQKTPSMRSQNVQSLIDRMEGLVGPIEDCGKCK